MSILRPFLAPLRLVWGWGWPNLPYSPPGGAVRAPWCEFVPDGRPACEFVPDGRPAIVPSRRRAADRAETCGRPPLPAPAGRRQNRKPRGAGASCGEPDAALAVRPDCRLAIRIPTPHGSSRGYGLPVCMALLTQNFSKGVKFQQRGQQRGQITHIPEVTSDRFLVLSSPSGPLVGPFAMASVPNRAVVGVCHVQVGLLATAPIRR